MFSTYFPAVLLAGLLAGLPASIFVTVSSPFIVWWAFMPPTFNIFPIGSLTAIGFGCVSVFKWMHSHGY
jgi:hypothetical protein